MAFRMEFGERRAPSKCCIQKLVKKFDARGSRSNACQLLSLGPIEGRSVEKYTPNNRTTQRSCTPRDSSCQLPYFGKSIPEFGETNSSVLGYEMWPVSASIMSRSCFASFPVCVYKFSSHFLKVKQGESLATGHKLLSLYTVEQRGFLFRKYWHTG